MPAKKAVKKPAKKKAAAKKKTAPAKKKATKKKAPAKRKAPPRKEAALKKTAAAKKPAPVVKADLKAPEKVTVKPAPEITEDMVDCPHCQGVGKCTYGDIFDKDRHQSLFSEPLLTSCVACLEAAGKPHNSKKLVACRVCGGTGKVAEDFKSLET